MHTPLEQAREASLHSLSLVQHAWPLEPQGAMTATHTLRVHLCPSAHLTFPGQHMRPACSGWGVKGAGR